MMANRCIILSLALLLHQAIQAQTTDDVPELIQQLEVLPEDIDVSGLFEFSAQKIDLNTANYAELMQSGFLSPAQALSIIDHIQRNGKIISAYELQSIESLDLETIHRLIPLLKTQSLKPKIDFKTLRFKGNNSITYRAQGVLQAQEGYNNDGRSDYLGSANKQYFNYRYQNEVLEWGLTFEKDAGEQFINPKTHEPEYLTGYLAIRNLPHKTSIILGNYTAQFGQGLAVFNGFGFGKSPMVTSTAKFGQGLKSYRSANEANYFRGIGISTQVLNKTRIHLYASQRNRDASYQITDSSSAFLDFNAIDLSGFHRTQTEIDKTSTVQESVLGSNIELDIQRLSLGYNVLYQKQEAHSSIAESAETSLGTSMIQSLYFSFPFLNVLSFGEIAAQEQSIAALLGLNIVLHPSLSLSILGRNISAKYANPLAAAFTESSKVQNEQGFYLGMEYLLHRKWTFNAYADHFYFPNASYLADYASKGSDYFQSLLFVPSKTLQFGLRHRYIQKERNAGSIPIETLEKTHNRELRFDVQYQLNQHLCISNRIQHKRYQFLNENHEGSLIYQDISIHFPKHKLKLEARYTAFNVGDFNARLYSFERDMPGNFNIQVFNNDGYKWYILLKKSLGKSLDCWIKYAQLSYENQQGIGTAGELIQGNTRSDLKVQLKYSF
jgi:hypothetical protein